MPCSFVAAATQWAWITSLRLVSKTGSETKPGLPENEVTSNCVMVESRSHSQTPYSPASFSLEKAMQG